MHIALHALQRGNVLFMILIAVALFAGLSYAVTSSSRNAAIRGSEHASLNAARIIQYGEAIKAELQRMRIITGKQDWQFDFSDNIYTSSTGGNTACAASDCALYMVKGGRMPSVDLGEKILSGGFKTTYPGIKRPYTVYRSIHVDEVGTQTDPELVLVIQGISIDICDKLNDVLIGKSISPVQALGAVGDYSGSLTDYPSSSGSSIGSSATDLKGKLSGCYKNASGNDYGNYYLVLLAR